MRLTLVEQEQIQADQDWMLEDKSEEADWLATGTEQLQLKASFS